LSCDDNGDYGWGATSTTCDRRPILEPYRWGKPFLTRAQREQIQWAIVALAVMLPTTMLSGWLAGRQSPAA
jgi:hypothetical protein